MDTEREVDKPKYKIVDINETNIDEYDTLCLKSKKDSEGYKNKLMWLKERFKEGLRLKLLLVREQSKKGTRFASRGFIEHIPGEYAWRGIAAKGYMVIHCIWVVGRNKKQGYGTKLLEQCLTDAKGMNGVVMVTTEKTWLAGRKFFIKNGFEKVDEVPPHFELYVKRFSDNAPLPRFSPISKEKLERYGSDLTIFRSDQCPYIPGATNRAVRIADEVNLPVKIEHIEDCKEAQNGVHPYGVFCVLLDGEVVSHYWPDEKAVELIRQRRLQK